MKRVYLEEDLDLIRKYFPGARAVSVRTPFDPEQNRRRRPRLPATFHDADDLRVWWQGGALWMN